MSDTTPPADAGTTAPPPPPPGPPRLLRRSSQDRWLGGVAAGIARYLNIDPVLARVGLIALAIVLFIPTVVLYVVSLFVIPSDDAPDTHAPHAIDRQLRVFAVIAGLVLVIGLLFNVDHRDGPFHTPWFFLVVLLVMVVVWMARRDRRSQQGPPWQGGPGPWTRFGGPAVPPGGAAVPPSGAGVPPGGPWPGGGQWAGAGWSGNPAWGGQPQPADAPAEPGRTADSVTQAVPAPPYPTAAYAAAPHATATAPYPPFPPVPDAPAKRERSALGPLTLGAALVTAGVLVALDRGDVFDIPAVAVFASALAVVGLGLLVGAWFGRSRKLIALGVVLAVLTALAGLVQFPANNSVGDQVWKPVTVDELQVEYEWGIGEVDLDLTALKSETPVTTSVKLGIGDMTVIVPRNATVTVDAHVGAGVIDVHHGDGTVESVDGISRDLVTTPRPKTADPKGTTFELDLSTGIGHVEVLRA